MPTQYHFGSRRIEQDPRTARERAVRIVQDAEQTALSEALVHMRKHFVGPAGDFGEQRLKLFLSLGAGADTRPVRRDIRH